MIFLDRNIEMVKEKYKRLRLSLRFGGIRTRNIRKRYAQAEKDDDTAKQ